jgi:hypothetical protein
MKTQILGVFVATAFASVILAQHEDHQHSYSGPEEVWDGLTWTPLAQER